MTRLFLGVLIWSVVHLIPGFAGDFKKNMLDRFGEYPYKGVFTLLMIVSLYLMISGWKLLTPEAPLELEMLYTPWEWGGHVAALFILIGFVLFLAPYPVNNFKRYLRHPQLIGMICWGVGHLLAVGTARSIVLFGGLSIWALIEILVLNRRDGKWVKPDPAPVKKDIALVLFAILAYLAFLFTHHLLFGGTELI